MSTTPRSAAQEKRLRYNGTVLQHPVGEKHLARIGDITVSFALLESTIQTLAHSFIGGQSVGQILTAEMSFGRLRALVTSLFREQHGEDANFEALRELMARASTLEAERNQITHSVWGAGADQTITRIKTTAKERHGLRFTFEAVSEDDLARIATDVKELADDVQRFSIALKGFR